MDAERCFLVDYDNYKTAQEVQIFVGGYPYK